MLTQLPLNKQNIEHTLARSNLGPIAYPVQYPVHSDPGSDPALIQVMNHVVNQVDTIFRVVIKGAKEDAERELKMQYWYYTMIVMSDTTPYENNGELVTFSYPKILLHRVLTTT